MGDGVHLARKGRLYVVAPANNGADSRAAPSAPTSHQFFHSFWVILCVFASWW